MPQFVEHFFYQPVGQLGFKGCRVQVFLQSVRGDDAYFSVQLSFAIYMCENGDEQVFPDQGDNLQGLFMHKRLQRFQDAG